MRIITLTTDFGTHDWFVGTMKGVIAGIASKAPVIDLTHEVPAGDIRAGAFALAASYRYFPKRTVHIAVVDPGVGSARKPIAVQTAHYFFVGPDNGVSSLALRTEKIKTIRALENKDYFLQPVSQTFHGRDIFAPVAAHLSRGLAIQTVGKAQTDFARLDWPEPRLRRARIEGEVIYIDRFGNGITNLNREILSSCAATSCEVHGRRRWTCPLRRFYQAVPVKMPVAVLGSSGFLEIAVNSGSAEKLLGLRLGTRVIARARPT